MLKILAVIFFGFFLTLQTVVAGAIQNKKLPDIPSWEVDEGLARLSPVKILPGNPFYFFIYLKEKIDYFREPNKTDKALFDVNLSGKRIKEAYLLAKKNEPQEVATSLKGYQDINVKLRDDLEGARSQGQPVFEVEKVLAENLERQLKIIVALAKDPKSEVFTRELSQAVETAKDTAKQLEKNLPDAKNRILNLANQIVI